MKAMKFQDDILSVPVDIFKDHYVIVFELTSMQDTTENCIYPQLVGEPLRLKLNVTFLLELVTELIDLGERLSSVAVDNFGIVGKKSKLDNVYLQAISTVSRYSKVGTVVHFLLTLFQVLTKTILDF